MRVAVLGSWDEKQNRKPNNPWPLLVVTSDGTS